MPARLPSLPRRSRPPTVLEQLLGRRRAATLRRRVGLLALGTSVSMLRPRHSGQTLALAGAMVAGVVLGVRLG